MLKRIKLGDLIKVKKAHSQTGPFGTQLKASDYVEEGTPVINVRNIGFGDIRANQLEYLDEAMSLELKNHKLRNKDIVFGRKGAVERHSLISENEDGWIQGSDCIRLRFLTNEYDPTFISFFFRTEEHKQWMINLGSFGATMGSLNQEIISKIEIPDIPLPIQQKIASILSAYDELIENNKQRIKLLEEMAEEIYKEWFVRLRFPNYENTEFVDGLPLGWEIRAFDEVAEYINGFAFKPTDWNDSGLPIIKISELKNGISESTPRNNGENVPLKLHVKQGELLFSWSADLNVYLWNNGEGLLNQHIFKVVPFETISKEYLFFCLKHHMATFKNKSNGATMHHIRRSALGEVFLSLPNVDLVERFTSIISPILSEVGVLAEKNQLLQQTRDLLLPRLISGKLSVAGLLEDKVYKIGENEERLSMAAEDETVYGLTN